MLRDALYLVAAIGVAAALLLALAGYIAFALWLALWPAILIVGLAIERWRYEELTAPRLGPEWQQTGERFVDPESGKLVTVYFHPATGERRYVAA